MAARVAAGIAGAFGFGRMLTNFLYGVSPADPPALPATAAVLLFTSAIAAWILARRGSRPDPAITLRHD